MKFFETLLSGLKAIILSHSYSKKDSDAKYLSKDKQAQPDWKTTNSKDPSFIKNKPTLIGKEGTGQNAEVFNSNNEASGQYSHAEGQGTEASGNSSHAEGYHTIASGRYSHAEGYQNTASGDYGSHAEGQGTEASGNSSHAEGNQAIASGKYSHAEGGHTTASGDYSHAEGSSTIASSYASHAEGVFTKTVGNGSHAEGMFTTANSRAQHVQGEYNIEDTIGSATQRGKYAHIVGNGTDYNALSNAHTLDWSGNAWFAGKVYVGGTSQDDAEELVTKTDLDVTKEEIASLNSIGKFCVPINDSVTGKQYYLTMRNGQLVSQGMVTSIEITKLPDKLDYVEGEVIVPDGMVVVATYEDGMTEELPLAQWVNNVPITGVTVILSYEQGNHSVSTTFNVNIIPIEDALIDFEYTANEDGTYTITAWKGTLNGEPSTEMVVPNSSLIYI